MGPFKKLQQTRLSGTTFYLLVLMFAGIAFIVVGNIAIFSTEQQYVYLADALLKGKLHFLEVPTAVNGWADTSKFEGNYYWPLGIFPALFISPFVLIFGTSFMQGYLSIFVVLATIYLLFKIALKLSGSKQKALFLSFAYVFGTAFYMAAFTPVSWYFAHVVASFCLVAAIYFTLIEYKPVFAGIFFTFGFLSRFSLILGGAFFIFYYLFIKKRGFKDIIAFLIPVLAGALVFFAYNYARFGSIFETGYKYQTSFAELDATRKYALWSLRHFPMHLYLLFLRGPKLFLVPGTLLLAEIRPSPLGMSFVFTSPALLFLVLANFKKKLNAISLSGALPMALFLFGTYGLGVFQYGYRFALDFQPFLYLILCDVFLKRKIKVPLLVLITISFIFNVIMTFLFFKTALAMKSDA